MNRLLVAIGSLALALCSTNVAESFDASSLPGPPAVGRGALGMVVSDATTDVRLCELATEKTQNPDVRYLCRVSAADNARIALQGMQIAARSGATDVALEPTAQTPHMLETLEHYSGREFDRSFLLQAIAFDGSFAHSLRYSMEFTNDQALKRFESGILATVLRHLDSEETLLRRLSEIF